MLAVVQRVSRACCKVEGRTVAVIGKGFVVFLAIGTNDTVMDASWMAKKIVNLRVLEDGNHHMNLSLFQIGGEILIVPEFTLYGDCKKGYRPNFLQAAPHKRAKELFCKVVDFLVEHPVKVSQGVFGARMKVELVNEGPVTLILNSDKN